MSFLAPFAFLFAAAIPVVVLFYLLKRRRTVRLVSSTLLWQKFLAESQANAPFQRLRHHWLLVLQILLLVLAVLALSRPYFAATDPEPGLLVVILDGSASMQSTDESPSRFEQARRRALELVDGLKSTDQMTVLLAAGTTVVKQSATGEKSALRRALAECAPADVPTRLVEAFKLAETLIQSRPRAEIHLFSDGALPDMSELQNRNLPVEFHRFGRRARNVGVVALDVRANPENPLQRAIFASFFNANTNAQVVDVQLRFNEELVEFRTLTIPGRATVPEVFLASQRVPGVFTVQIVSADDLAVDNRASQVSLLPTPVNVLLVTKGNRFLEKALRVAPHVVLSVAASSPSNGKGYDVLVLDDVPVLSPPEVNTLAIHTAATNWFGSWGRAERPPLVDWNHTHPLTRFVNLDDVQVMESLAVRPPPWGTTIVESQQTPLIVAGELGRQRLVWVGFDLLQSSWPLRFSFPIFVANAIDWLNPAAASAAQLLVRGGEAFRHPLNEGQVEAEVSRPDGQRVRLKLEEKARELVFADTGRGGVYEVRLGTNAVKFCVNLMDVSESDVTPRGELPLGRYGSVAETKLRRANLEYWRWFAAVALAVLCFEWWYYHRRTV